MRCSQLSLTVPAGKGEKKSSWKCLPESACRPACTSKWNGRNESFCEVILKRWNSTHRFAFFFYLQKTILWEKNIKNVFLQHFAYQGAGCSTWNKSVESVSVSKFGILLFKSSLKLIYSHCLLPGNHIWISQLAYEFLKSIKQLSLSLSHRTNTTHSVIFLHAGRPFISFLRFSVLSLSLCAWIVGTSKDASPIKRQLIVTDGVI